MCTAFNADFDGDQMAVHVPLSIEAQVEARVLVMSTNNILSPANGRPVINPSQDIVLGIYWMTRVRPGAKGFGQIFSNPQEVIYAYEMGHIDLQAEIECIIQGKRRKTSVGRVLLSDIVPDAVPFEMYNKVMNKKFLAELIDNTFRTSGGKLTAILADRLMDYGFKFSTIAGISICLDDLKIPKSKDKFLNLTRKQVDEIRSQYDEGLITESERYNKVVDIWAQCGDQIAKEMMKNLEKEQFKVKSKEVEGDSFNPIFIMADSGARGSAAQIRQLAGMRGLMAKPSGEIIDTPITANFREGLTVLQYFISTHGARKGLADTALKTANSGYLTRRLVDVVHDVIVSERDCKSQRYVTVKALREGGIVESIGDRVLGRTAFQDIVHPATSEVICHGNTEINEHVVKQIEELNIESVKIRSVLTCESKWGVCVKCYGRDLARGLTVNLAEPVGVIAAQSIGEPGTQLTMRTFHLGGTASRSIEQSVHVCSHAGKVRLDNTSIVENKNGKLVVMSRYGQLTIVDDQGNDKEIFKLVYGAILNVKENQSVKKSDVLAEWDPYSNVILADVSGTIQFKDIEEGVSVSEQVDAVTGFSTKVIIASKSTDQKPTLFLVDDKGEVCMFPNRQTPVRYTLPVGAQLLVSDGDKVKAGDMLVKMHRKSSQTRDITGGLPRVAELFEARVPKEAAIVSEIEGYVSFGRDLKGKQRVIVTSKSSEQKEYFIPKGKHVSVREGELIRIGETIMDGPSDPHDILKVSGELALASYLVNEVQEVYRLQGVTLN